MEEKSKQLLSVIAELNAAGFTGNITLNFHRGNMSKKYEVKTSLVFDESAMEHGEVQNSEK